MVSHGYKTTSTTWFSCLQRGIGLFNPGKKSKTVYRGMYPCNFIYSDLMRKNTVCSIKHQRWWKLWSIPCRGQGITLQHRALYFVFFFLSFFVCFFCCCFVCPWPLLWSRCFNLHLKRWRQTSTYFLTFNSSHQIVLLFACFIHPYAVLAGLTPEVVKNFSAFKKQSKMMPQTYFQKLQGNDITLHCWMCFSSYVSNLAVDYKFTIHFLRLQ